jgi:hypothetical protein
MDCVHLTFQGRRVLVAFSLMLDVSSSKDDFLWIYWGDVNLTCLVAFIGSKVMGGFYYVMF